MVSLSRLRAVEGWPCVALPSYPLNLSGGAKKSRPGAGRLRTQRDEGQQPRRQHEPGRQVERRVQTVMERRVGRADDLLDERPETRVTGGVLGDLAGLDGVDDQTLEADRHAEMIHLRDEAGVQLRI